MSMNLLAGLGNTGMIMVVYVLVIFGVMYFMTIRPQRKERAKMESMLSQMEVGDSVLTTSGFYGIIIDIQEDDCIVEFGNNRNCRIPMKKAAIAQIEKPHDAKTPTTQASATPVEEKKGFLDRFKKNND